MPSRPTKKTLRKPSAPKTPFDKIRKRAPTWAEGILSSKNDDLKNELAELELESKQIEDELKKDPEIAIYRERLRYLRAIYREPLTTNRLKMRVIALILEERGKV